MESNTEEIIKRLWYQNKSPKLNRKRPRIDTNPEIMRAQNSFRIEEIMKLPKQKECVIESDPNYQGVKCDNQNDLSDQVDQNDREQNDHDQVYQSDNDQVDQNDRDHESDQDDLIQRLYPKSKKTKAICRPIEDLVHVDFFHQGDTISCALTCMNGNPPSTPQVVLVKPWYQPPY